MHAFFQSIFFIDIPLHIDTANASSPSPMLNTISSIIPMFSSPKFLYLILLGLKFFMLFISYFWKIDKKSHTIFNHLYDFALQFTAYIIFKKCISYFKYTASISTVGVPVPSLYNWIAGCISSYEEKSISDISKTNSPI